jgi:hypothetical protein
MRPLLRTALTFALGAGSAALFMTATGPPVAVDRPPPARAERPVPRRTAWAAPLLPLPAASPVTADDAFTARVRQSGPPQLDPAFLGQMVPLLTRSLGALATRKHGNLLEVRCQSRSCLVRLGWPAEGAAARAQDPALFAPPEPGCEVTMSPPRDEQLRAGGPVEVSFLYQCPRWVQQVIEGAPSADDQVTTTEPPDGH